MLLIINESLIVRVEIPYADKTDTYFPPDYNQDNSKIPGKRLPTKPRMTFDTIFALSGLKKGDPDCWLWEAFYHLLKRKS